MKSGHERKTQLDVAAHAERDDVLGLALGVVEELGADDDLVLRLSPAALAGEAGTEADEKRRYLRSLLTEMGPEICDVLLKETTR